MGRDDLFKHIVVELYEGVYLVDRDRKILFWNQGAERITGYTEAETKGRYCFENRLRHVSEEGVELCKEGCPLHGVMTDGIEREAKVYLHHHHGHRVPVMVRAPCPFATRTRLLAP